jgi:hypothetical protein
MLIYPEVFACGRVVDTKDPRNILHHVQISASQAAATNGRILAIATYEPELDGPPAAVLVHADGMRLLDSASDKENPVQMTADEGEFVLSVGQEQVLEFHPKEPEGVFPDIRKLIKPYTERRPQYKVGFGLSVLKRLVRCLEGSTDSGDDRVVFGFYGPGEMVHWQVKTPVTEGMDFQGIVMPVKMVDEENPLQKAMEAMLPPPPVEQPEADSDTAGVSRDPSVRKAAKEFVDAVPKGTSVSISGGRGPGVTVDKRRGKTEIYRDPGRDK